MSPRRGVSRYSTTMRHPRPADWGFGVTVCVVAISTDDEIVAVSDHMLTVRDFGQDDMMIKMSGGPLKPGVGLSGDVHTSQTWANEQTRLSSCHRD